MRQSREPPVYRSHLLPRTTRGRLVVVLFVVLMALVEPPLVLLADRIQPVLLGLPFLYIYLLIVYLALIAVLLWALWERL